MSVIRSATEADIPGVAAIYDREVEIGHATFDTDPPAPSVWALKIGSRETGDHFLVAEDAGAVVGFAYAAPYRPRAAYRHTREVSVYLAPGAAGQGLGRRMYEELLPRLVADRVHTAVAAIAQPNPASEALHRAFGFQATGTLREVGFKHERWIDVALWQRLL